MNQEPTGCWTNDLELACEYDERGLITARAVATDAAVTGTAYEHDALGRLTQSVTEGVTSTYGWDAASNLVSESVSDDVTTNLADDGWEAVRTVNNANQLTQVVTDVHLPVVHTTTDTLDYDLRGNRTGSVTKRTTGGKTHTLARVDYRYDGMDQVTHVRDHGDNLNNPKDDTVTGWARDGLGRALAVTENGDTKQRVFDGTGLVVDGDTRITRAPGGAVLSEAFETVEGKGKNAITVTVSRDVLADVLGSAIAVAQGGIIDADLVFFTDFGEELFTPERVTVTGFTGRTDAAGLVEFETRAYDPVTRVWVQEDMYAGTVTRASSMNQYAYVEGTPETYVDAFGMFRAASAVAAQKLSAQDYATFMALFAFLAVRGVEQERQAKLRAIDAQWELEQGQISSGYYDTSTMWQDVGMSVAGFGRGLWDTAYGVGKFGWDVGPIAQGIKGVNCLRDFAACQDQQRQQRDQWWGVAKDLGSRWVTGVQLSAGLLTGDATLGDVWDNAFSLGNDYVWGGMVDAYKSGDYFAGGQQLGQLTGTAALIATPIKALPKTVTVTTPKPPVSTVTSTGGATVKLGDDFISYASGGGTAGRGGVGPVQQGAAGVQRTIADLEAAGGRVLGREVTVAAGGVRTRPDLFVQLPCGSRCFLEVKTGPGAGLTPNQTAGFPTIRSGGAVPVGGNAAAAGLRPGVPMGPTPVWVVRQPWPLAQ